MRPRRPTQLQVRRLLRGHVPGIQVRSLRVHEMGWDCRVFEVNGDRIFRFPRRPEARDWMERGLRFYPLLERRVPVPIPYVDVVARAPSGKLLFVGYPKLEGSPLPQRGLERPEARRWVRQLVEVFRALERVAPSDPGASAIPRLGREDMRRVWMRRAHRVLTALRPWLEPGVFRTERSFYETELGRPSFYPLRTVLCHGDLFPHHILVGRGDTGIRGILDWEDAVWGDPATNLASLPDDSGFARRVFDAWRPDDEDLWRRSRVYAHLEKGIMVREAILHGSSAAVRALLPLYREPELVG